MNASSDTTSFFTSRCRRDRPVATPDRARRCPSQPPLQRRHRSNRRCSPALWRRSSTRFRLPGLQPRPAAHRRRTRMIQRPEFRYHAAATPRRRVHPAFRQGRRIDDPGDYRQRRSERHRQHRRKRHQSQRRSSGLRGPARGRFQSIHDPHRRPEERGRRRMARQLPEPDGQGEQHRHVQLWPGYALGGRFVPRHLLRRRLNASHAPSHLARPRFDEGGGEEHGLRSGGRRQVGREPHQRRFSQPCEICPRWLRLPTGRWRRQLDLRFRPAGQLRLRRLAARTGSASGQGQQHGGDAP